MIINFQIVQNYALNYQDKHIDLHNNYDFASMEYYIKTMTLILRWIRSSGDWVHKEEPSHLSLIHKHVSYLSVSPRDAEMPLSEDSCLRDLTFFPSSLRDINDSIIGQSMPEEGDDILYSFQGDQIIRVNCAEIELLLDKI